MQGLTASPYTDYWNQETGDVQWDVPADYVEPKDKTALAHLMKPELKAAYVFLSHPQACVVYYLTRSSNLEQSTE